MPSYTQQDIMDQLLRIKQNKKRQGYMKPKSYQEFMPETLGMEKRDETQSFQILDQIRERGTDATRLAATIAQGKAERAEMIRRRQELKRARQDMRQAKASTPQFDPNVSYGGGTLPGNPNFKVGVGDYLTTVNWRGETFTVNKFAAPRFIGLLNDLAKAGYRPVTVQGYNNRNIAGTDTKSLHAYGLAIDIDPGRNPVGANRGALPPNVAALAAKYGLSWGGSWDSYKDPMHFSVPYGGTE